MLNENDAVWAADQFIEYYSQFNRIDDYLRFVKTSRLQVKRKLFGPEDQIFSDFDIHPNDMKFKRCNSNSNLLYYTQII